MIKVVWFAMAATAAGVCSAAVELKPGRQMFLDDSLVATSTMKRVWHRPVTDGRSPVLRPETQLELNGGTGDPKRNPMSAPFSGGVWYDGQDGLFKCWYIAGWTPGVAYATSKDGLKWDRPDLDGKGGNLVIHTESMSDSNAVYIDPDAADGYRFKGFAFDLKQMKGRPQNCVGGKLFRSRDGVHWTDGVLTDGVGDRTTIFYNPFTKRHVYSIRSGKEKGGLVYGRWRCYADGTDFIADGVKFRNRVIWELEGSAGGRQVNGQELYNFDAVAYEGVMIGLAMVMNSPQNDYWDHRGLPKLTDLKLGFNTKPEDFRAWKFVGEKEYGDHDEFFISSTRAYGTWNCGYLQSNAAICIIVGDELRFYYTGFAGDTSKTPRNGVRRQSNQFSGMYANATMGFATLRRDGFCSMEDGMLKTKPLVFPKGDRLWVNADVAEGELTVRANGRAKVLKGVNATKIEVGSVKAGEPVELDFAAKGGAKLYSYWVSDASGKSGGYLAGGCVGCRTLRDE